MRITLILLAIIVNTQFSVAQYNDTLEIGMTKFSLLIINGVKLNKLDLDTSKIKVLFDTDIPGYENGVIKLRAKSDFPLTNAIIYATDTILTFALKYTENPRRIINKYNLAAPVSNKTVGASVELAGPENINIQQQNTVTSSDANGFIRFKEVCNSKTKKVSRKKDSKNLTVGGIKNRLKVVLTNLASDSNYLYVRISFANRSRIDYIIEDVKFQSLTRPKKLKGASIQSRYFTSEPSVSNPKAVIGGSQAYLYYRLDEIFALGDDEELRIHIFERSRTTKGRTFLIRVNQQTFNNAVGKL